MADAKVKAIEQAMTDVEIGEDRKLPGVPGVNFEERILDWVHAIPSPETLLAQKGPLVPSQSEPIQNAASPQFPGTSVPNLLQPQIDDSSQHVPVIASTLIRDVTRSQLNETLTSANQQIVAGLARQNFPKCQPDIFNGDAKLFHPWKAAFKPMIKDADVSPVQEINYLRSFTSGEPQRLVDNFRRRQTDPVTLLQSLWKELEICFGSAAIITNALLERMQKGAMFNDVIEKGEYGLPEAPLSTPDENFNRPNSAQPSPPSYAAAANPAPQTAHDQPPAFPVNNADNELPSRPCTAFLNPRVRLTHSEFF